MSPNEFVRDFITGLPDTIRQDVAFFVAHYSDVRAVREELDRSNDFDVVAFAVAIIDPPAEGYEKVGAAIRVSAILDYVFETREPMSKQTLALLKQAADSSESEGLMKVVLGAPLRARHMEQAADRWRELRGGPLSQAAIRDFERKALGPRRATT